MKLAIFKRIDPSYSYETILEDDSCLCESDDYARLSEFVEVEFPMLPPDEAVKKECAAIDEKINAVRAEAVRVIEKLELQKSKLLAYENVG